MNKHEEVEVAFKVTQNLKQCEELLIKAGYTLLFSTQTHDLYFTNKTLTPEMSEQQLKFSCIRFRHSGGGCSFDNYKLFSPLEEDRIKCTFIQAVNIINNLLNSGYHLAFDTYKTDSVYKKDSSYHQLQDIKHIGLLDYFYDETLFNESASVQFEKLTKKMKELGFNLEFDEGVDKLRTLLNEKYCFSKNQNGNYNQM